MDHQMVRPMSSLTCPPGAALLERCLPRFRSAGAAGSPLACVNLPLLQAQRLLPART